MIPTLNSDDYIYFRAVGAWAWNSVALSKDLLLRWMKTRAFVGGHSVINEIDYKHKLN